jgi:hypothetical protein
MTEALTNFTLNGTTFKYLNGSRNESSLLGSIKQFDGSKWNRLEVAGKTKEKNISFSGFVTTDEEKQLLQALESDTVYTDYSDGETTLTKCVVMDISFSFNINSPYGWNYTIIIEEYNQE